MATINILCYSSRSSFIKKLRGILPVSKTQDSPGSSFKIHPFSALSEVVHPDLKNTSPLLILDLDSFETDVDKTVTAFTERFKEQTLILVSDHPEPTSIQFNHKLLKVNHINLESSLFSAFVHALTSQSALISSNLEVQEDLNYRLNELLLIRKAGLHLTMNLSLDAVLEAILESAMELVSADDTHVFHFENGVISFASALFNGNQQKEPYMHPRPEGITYQVARKGKKIVINDTLSHPLFKDRPWEGSIISLPLKIGNKVLGVMNVALKRAHEFTEHEIRSLEFLADQASIAIQNAKLYEQAQQEIADRKKAEKAIKHLANHDALTGLPNRRLFNERILLEISRAQRNNQIIGVMLFDLDQLKRVNDTYGHNVGDLVLQAVAQRLLGLLRKSDTVARMGGDEFLLILPEMQEKSDAVQTAERILSALSTPFLLEGYEVNITTSIGVSFFPVDGDDADSLIKRADIAMYKAKEKGGNIYHIFTE
jgi:diguanylate cyclase (GGDEF)-like protein